MTKEQKNELIDQLAENFKESSSVIVANYKGCSHKSLEDLRREASESEVTVRVVKNTLVNIALDKAGLPKLELEQPNIFLWSNDQMSSAKVADKFASDNKETFSIVTGIIENKVASIDTINAFAKLPSKDELLGMLAATWLAPITNFTIGLDALRKQKEEAA